MLQKLKDLLSNDTLFYSALLVMVAGASFGLGRQSMVERQSDTVPQAKDSVVLTQPKKQPEAAETPVSAPTIITQPAAATAAVSGEVVASKSGTKYHLPTCSGAKSIKPANLISFESIAAAEAAGYTPAANCPGLQ